MNNALIWGAGGGIGRSIVTELKTNGWTTFSIARDISEIPSSTDFKYEADFKNPTNVEHAVYKIAQEVESIDLLIYTAGDILSKKVIQMTPEDWETIMTANLTGAYHAIHYSLPLLSDSAHIVILGAISERLRLPGFSAYAAAKAGLEAFAEALSKEERSKRITVVRPGAVATSLWDKVPMRLPKNAATTEKVAKKIIEIYKTGSSGHFDLM
jgi:NAD(P)-dependent dehydrogenase (short-subunit alcohol dehydrogenase family)